MTDLSPEAFLFYAKTTRDQRVAAYTISNYVGHLAWQILVETGHFPRNAPPTLRAALRSPQLTSAQLVDQYAVKDAEVREMLISYIDRRRIDLDYTSTAGIASTLVLLFWKALEKYDPSRNSLRVDAPTYARWRSEFSVLPNGQQRMSIDRSLIIIRALYYDIRDWAVAEPEIWARWVEPCPIPAAEFRSGRKRRLQARERTHAAIRSLAPLLDTFTGYVEKQKNFYGELLALASGASPGTIVAVGERRFERIYTAADHKRERGHGFCNIRVRELADGRSINVSSSEETAFWTWAIVDGFRHSGLRSEELLELTQLSIRKYKRPNSEIVPLLVVAPSKVDRERVIPMSPDLLHVFASIIRRLGGVVDGRLPLATRYDGFERVTSPPAPFLFQRRIGQRNEVMTPGAVSEMLRRTSRAASRAHPELEGVVFRQHDFRRLFATDLMNSGLPIHIGAKLLGHLNLETTRGYVAVFEEKVVQEYQAHLLRRRQMRPRDEYSEVSDREWSEFQQHFESRKLELGSCARPYGTPCRHEHACIRCPMLTVDAKEPTVARLNEIHRDLLSRRKKAMQEGWVGEVEGLDLTILAITAKIEKAAIVAKRGPVTLPAPKVRG